MQTTRDAVAGGVEPDDPFRPEAVTGPDIARSSGEWKAQLELGIWQGFRAVAPDVVSHAQVKSPDTFQGLFHAGAVHDLAYGVLKADAQAYMHRSRLCEPTAHVVVVQRAGSCSFSTARGSFTARPGDIVMLGDLRDLHVENEEPIDQVLLFEPLDGHAVARLADHGSVLRLPRSEASGMALRWVDDICRPRHWRQAGVVRSLAQATRSLLSEALEAPHQPTFYPRLDRAVIEVTVERRLEDPSLTLQSLADELGCSVRTLHRTFSGSGDESLERYIRRRRIEACAAALLSATASQVSLADLAYRFGFSSHAHFTTAFRQHFGVTPSAFRRRN